MLYPWLQSTFQEWQQLLQSPRQPHAILLSGAPGLGKKELVKATLTNLWCKQNHCGTCKHCQWIAQGTHPDSCYLVLEENAKSIKIDDVRAACEWLQLSPLQTQKKVLIINPAEALNTAASNALLKTLEEPPASALVILVSERPQQLLATVRSRCLKINIKMPDSDTMLAWLKQQLPETQQFPMVQGLGPLAIMDLLNDEKAASFNNITAIIQQVFQKKMFFIEAAEKLKGFSIREIIAALEFFCISQIQTMAQQNNLAALKNWLIYETQLTQAKSFAYRNANLNDQLQCEQLLMGLGNIM